MSLKEYRELLSLTSSYLCQEFQTADMIVSERETYDYFKEIAIRNKGQKPAPNPVVQQAAPKTYTAPLSIAKPNIVQEEKQEIAVIPVVKVAETPKVETDKRKGFELEKVKAITPQDLSDVKKMIRNLFPHQIILDQIIQEMPQVVIISDNSENEIQRFIANYAKAIDLMLAPAKVMSSAKFKTSVPKDLKMIIQTTDPIEFKDDKILTLQLSDLTQYLKEPSLKAELWELTKSKFLDA